METFKQLMGFVLLGTVVWLMTGIHWVYLVPTVAMIMGLWASCWWIGRTPLTADLHAKLRAWGWAVTFAAFMGLVSFAWLKPYMAKSFETMLDKYFAARLESAGHGSDWDMFLLERREKVAAAQPDELPWQAFTPRRLELLKQRGYTVLIDFTAQWCPTCKTNKAFALNTRETRRIVDSNNVVTLIADMTEESPEANELLKRLGNTAQAIPYFAVFPAERPDEPILFDGVLLPQQVIDALRQAGPSKDAPRNNVTAMRSQ